MFKLLLKFITSVFTADRIGLVVRIILSQAGKAILRSLLDAGNQKVAYQFVKELHQRDDLTNEEKRKLFNQKFAMWAAAGGKQIKESTVNCLREMALAALKAQLGK